MQHTALYRLYDAGGHLLYVGIASQPRNRWGNHATLKPWWPEVAEKRLEWHPDRWYALVAEHMAIINENPRYNRDRQKPKTRTWRNKDAARLLDELTAA